MPQQNLVAELRINTGFYGKLPVLGDFISRNLPREFILPWDQWLQSSLAVSKEKLNERWLDYYLTSPIWRFVLCRGICSDDAWVGIIMPSVDRVGRYYPLTLATRLPADLAETECLPMVNVWFDEAENIALNALEQDSQVAELESCLALILKDLPEPLLIDEQSNQIQQFEDQVLLTGTHSPVQLVTSGVFHSGCSIWCTQGSEDISAACIQFNGLPSVDMYHSYISGEFAAQGWSLKVSAKTYADHSADLSEPDLQGDLSALSNALLATPQQREKIMSWRSYAKTDKGCVRQLNEDAVFDRPDLGLWIVADGMGGHQAGDLASKKIIHKFLDVTNHQPLEQALTLARHKLYEVNTELRLLGQSKGEQQIIGSTVVALMAGESHFACLWAGDSRLYRLRDHQLQQLTIDHCEPSPDVNALLMHEANALKSNNVITRAVGAFDELELDCQLTETLPGDVFLLSSDGLDKELSLNEIEQVLNQNCYHDSVDVLVEKVLQRGGRDNVSVIVIELIGNI